VNGNVEKSRQRRSRPFAVLTYYEYAPRVKRAAALPVEGRVLARLGWAGQTRDFFEHSLPLMMSVSCRWLCGGEAGEVHVYLGENHHEGRVVVVGDGGVGDTTVSDDDPDGFGFSKYGAE